MSLRLERGTEGKVKIKTWGFDDSMDIEINGLTAKISDADMKSLICYWLTNSSTSDKSIKVELLDLLKRYKIEPDPNEAGKIFIYIEGFNWWGNQEGI